MRLFDVFVDSLDMPPLDFVQSIPKGTGIPGYDPRDLLKQRQHNKGIQEVQQALYGTKAFLKVLYLYRW